VARLFGNFVLFRPSFDSEFMVLADEVGRAAREATTGECVRRPRRIRGLGKIPRVLEPHLAKHHIHQPIPINIQRGRAEAGLKTWRTSYRVAHPRGVILPLKPVGGLRFAAR
jgi:hypothetical protein